MITMEFDNIKHKPYRSKTYYNEGTGTLTPR